MSFFAKFRFAAPIVLRLQGIINICFASHFGIVAYFGGSKPPPYICMTGSESGSLPTQ